MPASIARPGVLDVRLLRLFVALMDCGALCRAAARLGISESSASRELARLRQTLGDPLFRKTALGMKPTEHALAVDPSIREALASMEKLLETSAR